MNRRNFLRNGSLAGFTFPALISATAHAEAVDHDAEVSKKLH